MLVFPSHHPGWGRVEATLRRLPGVTVMSAGPGQASALAVALAERADVIVCDRIIDGVPASTLFAPVLSDPPGTALVILSESVGRADWRLVLRGAVSGYLMWGDLSTPAWPTYIAAAVDARAAVVSRAAIAAWREDERRLVEHSDFAITARERYILQELSAGETHAAIARALDIHVRTVERVIDVLQRKLDAASTARLLVRAAQLGLVE
ncbi:MAG TPA: LuxR C-terminal-related transcriptional regulator [Thermomicrobiales bacterium]|nr:LuxR C-terminal-related transcriptional regulator [Thermomicrobiales bacterium]